MRSEAPAPFHGINFGCKREDGRLLREVFLEETHQVLTVGRERQD
jgi:hypothetical protein